MKIVHFAAGRVNPAAAKVGLVNVVYWLAREQAQAGNHVSVVVMPTTTDYENIQDAPFEILEYRRPTLGGFRIDRKLFDDIDKEKIQIDIAHLHSVWSPAMVTLGGELRKRGIPYVVSSHGSFSPILLKKPRLLKQGFRILCGLGLANHSAFVHLHSSDEVQDAISFGVKAPLVIAEQGIESSAIPTNSPRDWFVKNYPQYQGTFKILFLGRLDPWHKGIDLLLRATAIALKTAPDITLFLMGPEKRRYRTEIPALIEQLGIGERVVLTGPIYAPGKKYSAMASADCFALTSRFEGFPLTVLEAMVCGTPVIITPGTNAAGIVQAGEAGLICEPDPVSIAKALLDLKCDSSKRTQMGRSGAAAALQYTWHRTADTLLKAYSRVLGR
jgi:glycosyltransferase involved in cell wall biosynthesis